MSAYFNGYNFDGTMEDIVHAAREFGRKMQDMGRGFAQETGAWDFESKAERIFDKGPARHCFRSSFYFYPPANIYESRDGSLVLEFSLSGIEERGITVEFKGDYLVLSAKAAPREEDGGDYYRRGFRPRDIDRQKYFVPAGEYAQERAKATFKNGMLTVAVPPKESAQEGIKVTIEKEGA
jgi:HSP20 family molecular chaperone IbpA